MLSLEWRFPRVATYCYLSVSIIVLGVDHAANIARVSGLVKAVQDGSVSVDDAVQDSAIDEIRLALKTWRNSMMSHRTARPWIQHQTVVEILRSLICSVRTGNWFLHLEALCDLHPYLAASGHNNYTKSLASCIPRMINLKSTHPEVYAAFA